MANSGYTDVKVTDWDTLRFYWEVSSQSVAANTSTVAWKMQLIATGSGRISAGGSSPWSITVNGTQYTGSENIGIANNQTKTLASGTTVISHGSDGNKTFSYSFQQTFNITFSGVYISIKSGTGSGVLPLIARTSSPQLSTSSVDMGERVTITTNRQSTSVTHDLEYSFAGGSYVTFATSVGDSYSWITPDLASKIPNAVSGVCTVRCTSKASGQTIGTSIMSLTLKVPASVIPSVSAINFAEATNGIAAKFGAYIQGRSTLNINVAASGVKGSTVRDYKVDVMGVVYSGQSFTSGPLVLSGTRSITATVTDSRGRTGSKSVNIEVTAYPPPVVSEFKAIRCNASGVEAEDGTFLKLSYSYSVADLGGRNTANMVIEYKRSTDTYYTGTLATSTNLAETKTVFFPSPAFSTDYQYDIRISVTDWFGVPASYTVNLRTEDVVMDFSADGRSISFGKVSQRENAQETARTMYDEYDTLLGNGRAVYNGSYSNAVDANTTLEHLCITNKNTPTDDLWYVTTIFEGEKSTNANRLQYFIPHSPGGAIYSRVYEGGMWQDFTEIPAKFAEFDSGYWHVRILSDGWVECTGIRELTNITVGLSAGGGWYKSYEFTPGTFPVEIENPVVSINYESNGYGALLVPTTIATTTTTAKYYFMQPSNTTIASGRVVMRVSGRLA